jgi:hypothetical protein
MHDLTFRSGGRVFGIVGIVLAAGFLAYGLLDGSADFPSWLLAATVLFGAALWAVLVRPGVLLRDDALILRNILRDRSIPYARITDFRVTQVTLVDTVERRYVGVGFGRVRTSIRREGLGDGHGTGVDVLAHMGNVLDASDRTHTSVGDLAQGQVGQRVSRAQVFDRDPAPVRTSYAWPEIVVLVVLAVATVALALT